VKKKREEAVLQGHTFRVSSIVITCDDKYIVSGSYDNTVRVWFMKKNSRSLDLVNKSLLIHNPISVNLNIFTI
jgi:WD40 repeat protein